MMQGVENAALFRRWGWNVVIAAALFGPLGMVTLWSVLGAPLPTQLLLRDGGLLFLGFLLVGIVATFAFFVSADRFSRTSATRFGDTST